MRPPHRGKSVPQLRPNIDSVTLELTDGRELALSWEADYDDEGDELTTGTWSTEVFDEYGDSEDYRESEEWELRAACLWNPAPIDEPLTSANWEGDGA
jgi:hypothetical protein